MIKEVVNYTKYLKENSRMIFEEGLEPSQGLHIFLELDENGELINFPGEKGENWDFYDGKEISPFLKKIIPYEQEGIRIGTNMNKVFDKKKQLVSCSPYLISFKKEKLENEKLKGNYFDKIINLLPFYFDRAIKECIYEDESLTQKSVSFKSALVENLTFLSNIREFDEMKKTNFINIYLKNISLEDYKKAHNNYLKKNLFNTDKYNSEKEIQNNTYGLSSFINGLNVKKPFLEHKTASMYKGIPCRIQAKDTVFLNDFDLLLKRKNNKVFPNPLPIFIDKNEFDNADEIISIFKQNGKLTYSQILKELFKDNPDKTLQNYYLLFFNYKHELEDFDFVSKFRYSMKTNNEYPLIQNLFKIKINKEKTKRDYKVENIFQFEMDIVKTVFNNSLVRLKEDSLNLNYFGEIKPEYVSGGDLVYQMIIKYRKAIYDYIYKSKTQAISCLMFDEIMWNSIIADLRTDKITDKGYHSKETIIKEKLNIWFSLYNYFINNQNRITMASKIPELLERIKEVANTNDKHFESDEEFAFGAGQVIYFLLNQSKASERTHALLEPFIQKVNVTQLQNSISRTINTYKHEISFGHGRFEKLSSEVLAYNTETNLKNLQRLLLAGYFSTPVIYEKSKKEEKPEINEN